MSVVFPESSRLPVGGPGTPLPDVVAVLILKEHPDLEAFGLTVDLALRPSDRVPPFVRVGLVRHLETSSPGESAPILALDVYSDDVFDAQTIALRIASAWPRLRGVTVPAEGAFVSGGWVEVDPWPLAEPDVGDGGSDLARYHLEVGLRLHPIPAA